MIKMVRFYLFSLRWLYKNRDWKDNRQKYKQLNRVWAEYERTRRLKGVKHGSRI